MFYDRGDNDNFQTYILWLDDYRHIVECVPSLRHRYTGRRGSSLHLEIDALADMSSLHYVQSVSTLPRRCSQAAEDDIDRLQQQLPY